MSIEVDFKDLMKETVTIYAQSSLDKWGKPTWDSGTEYSARVVWKSNTYIDDFDRVVNEKGRAYMYGFVEPGEHAKIELADGEQQKIITTEREPDENGDHHTVVKFGDINTRDVAPV